MRLTESYMMLGIKNEAQNAAAVLGHNFPDSQWYKDAYALLASDGLAPRELVRLHSEAAYRVFFLGFLPGFAYLDGLPPALHTPRRATPRTAVPAGSVGIGGAQTGIYPSASPGGWQLIGHTRLKLFDPTAAQPTLLQPGDRVRFVCEELRHA